MTPTASNRRRLTIAFALLVATSPLPALAQQAVYPVVPEAVTDPLLADLSIPANAAQAGMWSRVFATPIVAIHSSVLPDGRVLTFGAAPGGDVQDGRTLVFWDPRKGVGANAFQVLPNAQNVDSFCATATLLSDGRLLTSGGATFESGYSSRESMVLDWKTSAPTRDYDLTAQRWYGTMTKLPDGRVVITGGGAPYTNGDPNRPEAAPDVSSTPEIYTPGQGWRSLLGAYSTDAFGARNGRWWYPRQWVSPTGSLFGVSTEKMWEMQVGGNGAIRTIRDFKTAANNATRPNVGPTSTAVMYDTGKILQVGGNGYFNGYPTNSSAAATIFDINAIGAGRVDVTEAAGMANPRQWASSVILPNGRVLVVGGTRFGDDAGANAVLAAETWNPANGTWTTGSAGAVYRGYHSTASLLPNGTVIVGGGGIPGPVRNSNAEIYYPPYLFRQQNGQSVLATRPRIVSMSSNTLNYNQNAEVQTGTGDTVAEVSLIAVSSVTHSFDSNQRRMKLAFQRNANGITLTLPNSPNLAPPGYYLLSVVNDTGVPSTGMMVSIGAAAPGRSAATPVAPTTTPVTPPAPPPPPTPPPTPTPPPATPPVTPPVTPPATPAPTPSATGTQFGSGARTIAAAQDGTVATANVADDIWVNRNGGWSMLPGKFRDVAVIAANRYYALGTDQSVYRWTDNRWRFVGHESRAIAAAADGTVVSINPRTNQVWIKDADDNESWWKPAPGVLAKSVAVLKRGSLYYVGMDNNVWRSDMVRPPVRIGSNVTAIAASADGTITVINPAGTIWRKIGDDTREAWGPLSGTATKLATVNAGTMIYTDKNGGIFRR